MEVLLDLNPIEKFWANLKNKIRKAIPHFETLLIMSLNRSFENQVAIKATDFSRSPFYMGQILASF